MPHLLLDISVSYKKHYALLLLFGKSSVFVLDKMASESLWFVTCCSEDCQFRLNMYDVQRARGNFYLSSFTAKHDISC